MQVSDIRETAEMFALAFAENPNTRAILADPLSKKSLNAMAKITSDAKLCRKFSNVFVAKIDGKIVGAINFAYWPHCQPSLFEKLALMPKMIFVMGKALPKAMTVMSAWGKNDPKKNHCHIGPLGVLPDFQGKGIGSKLIKHCLELTDASKTDSYLETDAPKNLPLYQRHGFTVIKEIPIYNYMTWLMWRDAK